MKKLLIVTKNFPPAQGGIERMVWRLTHELARHYEIHLIAPYGAREYVPPGVSVTEVPLNPLSRFLLTSLVRTVICRMRWQPDVILAASGLTALAVRLSTLSGNARSLALTYGLDMTVDDGIYRTFWLPALRKLDRVITISHASARLAAEAGIDRARTEIIFPGVDMPPVDTDRRRRFRAAHNLSDTPILLSVGRLTARKGLVEFVSTVLPEIVRQRPDVILAIVGTVPKNSLSAPPQTPEQIRAAARTAGVESRLRFLGRLSEEELSDAYAGSDVFVFPVRRIKNDAEGFGLVALEAAAHGLPTVATAVDGVVDAVSEGVSGRLIPPDDHQAFADAVIALLEQRPTTESLQSFSREFTWDKVADRMATSIDSLL